MNDVVYKEEEEIHKLKIELAETQRDREMLATELERVKNEYKHSMTLPVPSISVNDTGGVDESKLEMLRSEKARLIAENEALLSSNVQLATLQEIVSEGEDNSKTENIDSERVMVKLLTKLESTKRENEELSRKLGTDSSGGRISGMFAKDTRNMATSPVKDTIHSVVSPVEIQSLQQVNGKLKQEVDHLKKEREKFKRDLARIQQAKVNPDYILNWKKKNRFKREMVNLLRLRKEEGFVRDGMRVWPYFALGFSLKNVRVFGFYISDGTGLFLEF